MAHGNEPVVIPPESHSYGESAAVGRFSQEIFPGTKSNSQRAGYPVRLEREASDEKSAKKILRGVLIGPHGRAGRLPLMALSADVVSGFPDLPGQNCNGDRWSNELNAGDHRGRLIYRSVNFVVGSLGKV